MSKIYGWKYYFINQEKFGIPPNLPKIRIKNNPRDNDYKIVMDESYLDEKSEKSIELVYEDMMKKLGEIRIWSTLNYSRTTQKKS